MPNLREYINECYQVADEHGWHDKPRTFGDLNMLIVGELSEAMEDFRNGHAMNEIWYEPDGKPCGIPTEFADVIIRMFDACKILGIDLEEAYRIKTEFNKTRPYRHGNKSLG